MPCLERIKDMEKQLLQKTTADNIETFVQKKNRLITMGGVQMIRKQKEQGKLTARERIDFLFDKETFQ
jgi:acetyl-CoA carboxylase carboxyltransferase component